VSPICISIDHAPLSYPSLTVGVVPTTDTDDDDHAEVHAGGNKGKDATDVPPPEKVKEHTAARGEGVLPSRRGRAPEDVGQGSAGKRSRIDPVAARKRFDSQF